MTRKDYIGLAKAFRLAQTYDVEGEAMQHGFDLAVNIVMDTLKVDNPRFDRQRFVKACQPLVEQAQLKGS